MIGGIHLSGDKTLVKANASLDSLEPRLVIQSPEAFVARLFAENLVPNAEAKEPAPVLSLTAHPGYPTQWPLAAADPREPAGEPATEQIPPSVAPVEPAVGSVSADVPPTSVDPAPAPEGTPATSDSVSPAVASAAANTTPEPATEGAAAVAAATASPQPGKDKPALSNATHVSHSDPEATLVARPKVPPMLAYRAEVWTDARAGVITHADAATGAQPEHVTALGAICRQREALGLAVATVAYDKACGQGRVYRQLQEAGIVGFIPHQKYVNVTSGPGLYSLADFTYNPEKGVYECPGEHELHYSCLRVHWPTASHTWQATPSACQSCERRSRCTKSAEYRTLQVSMYQPYYEEMDQRLAGPGARLAAIARRTGPEARFAEGKQWMGLARAKYRGLAKVKGQVLLTATAQNLKKLVKWVWRQTKGTGKGEAVDSSQSLCFRLLGGLPACPDPIPL